MAGGNLISIIKNCQECGKEIKVYPSHTPKNGGKYCSFGCRGKAQSRNYSGENSPSWKGGLVNRNCEICDREITVLPSQIIKGGGKYCSPKCMGQARIDKYAGENNPNWRGGVASERENMRGSSTYREWRKSTFARDNWTCQDCGIKSKGDIQAHHIFSFAEFPEHRFDIWNGVTLCVKCHAEYHPSLRHMIDSA